MEKKKIKTKWPVARRIYKIPDHISDEQVHRYAKVKSIKIDGDTGKIEWT